jgi:hypothetical protein
MRNRLPRARHEGHDILLECIIFLSFTEMNVKKSTKCRQYRESCNLYFMQLAYFIGWFASLLSLTKPGQENRSLNLADNQPVEQHP